MSLLFHEPLIAGLDYREELISEAEERKLLEHLMPLELAPFRFHGWLGNRKTQSFGWRYDFDDASFTPTDPLPGWLHPLRAQRRQFRAALATRICSRPARAIRSRSGHRLAPRPRCLRQCRRRFAELIRDPALAPTYGRRLPAREPRSGAGVRLPVVRRVTVGMGAQHRAGRPAPFLDNFPYLVQQRPPHRCQTVTERSASGTVFCGNAMEVTAAADAAGGLLKRPRG